MTDIDAIERCRHIIADHCFGPHVDSVTELRALEIAAACTDDMVDEGLLAAPAAQPAEPNLWVKQIENPKELPGLLLRMADLLDALESLPASLRRCADVARIQAQWKPEDPASPAAPADDEAAIERMTAAIWNGFFSNPLWYGEIDHSVRALWRGMATAALAALGGGTAEVSDELHDQVRAAMNVATAQHGDLVDAVADRIERDIVRPLAAEHEKWAAAIAETAVRLSDAGYHGQLVDSVTRLLADRETLAWLHAEAVWRIEGLRAWAHAQSRDRDRWLGSWQRAVREHEVAQSDGHGEINALKIKLAELSDMLRGMARRAVRRGREADGGAALAAALRASAVVLPEDAEELLTAALEDKQSGIITMDDAGPEFDAQYAARIALDLVRSWRPEAAPAVRVDTEWCVFYGGPDPYNSAGIEFYDDEADATEKIQWYEQPAGVAQRTVRRGPWETQAAGASGTGTEAPTAGIALADELWPPGTEADPFPDLTEAEAREGSDA